MISGAFIQHLRLVPSWIEDDYLSFHNYRVFIGTKDKFTARYSAVDVDVDVGVDLHHVRRRFGPILPGTTAG